MPDIITKHPAALSAEDLKRLTGYQRSADVERWCQENGVRFLRGRNGAWTTIDAVNRALGLHSGDQSATRPTIEF